MTDKGSVSSTDKAVFHSGIFDMEQQSDATFYSPSESRALSETSYVL